MEWSVTLEVKIITTAPSFSGWVPLLEPWNCFVHWTLTEYISGQHFSSATTGDSGFPSSGTQLEVAISNFSQ